MEGKRRKGEAPSFDAPYVRENAETIIQNGARKDDILETEDGTVVRITSGKVKGSIRGCKAWRLPLLPGVQYDSLDKCVALGQSCSCMNKGFIECTHEPSASFAIESIGHKLLEACERCGTESGSLLNKVLTWAQALRIVRGDSDEIPSLQLRRTLFHHAPELKPSDVPSGSRVVKDPFKSGESVLVREVPGLPGVFAECSPGDYGHDERASVAKEVVVEAAGADCYDKVCLLTPPQLKSLLQKLIRWGKSVEVVGNLANAVLSSAFIALVFGPGQFLPELGLHSKGPRLALQRAVVAMFEDGIDPGDASSLTFLAATAAICQERPFKLSKRFLLAVCQILIRARHSNSVITWRGQSEEGEPLFADLVSIFGQIGAMPGDLKMFAAVKRIEYKSVVPNFETVFTLDEILYSHIDQHCEEGMPHCVEIFDWFGSTGANHREGRPLNSSLLKRLSSAQKCALYSTTKLGEKRSLAAIAAIEVPIDAVTEEVAAYCAGEITVKVRNAQYIAVFCPTNINKIVIMKRPNRDSEDICYIAANSHVYREVVAVMKKKPVPLSQPYSGGSLSFEKDKWVLKGVKSEPMITVDIHADDADVYDVKGTGVRAGYREKLTAAFLGLVYRDRSEVIRVMCVITPSGDVRMAPILRSATPVGSRFQVYTFLITLCGLCPGCLMPTRAAVFKIVNGLLFAHVRALLVEAFVNAVPVEGTAWLSPLGELRSGQKACLETIISTTAAQTRSFALATTGAGKTAVAAHLLCSVAKEVECAFLFIDTIKSGLAVCSELEKRCTAKIYFLDPRKSSKQHVHRVLGGELKDNPSPEARPKRRAINLVMYDHFASYDRFRDNILRVAPASFAIYDEIDKCYGETKRSRICVPYAMLFRHLVMMSATALRKHSECVAPRAAIAGLFAPIPIRKSNLLVFFAGKVHRFEHDVPFEIHRKVQYIYIEPHPAKKTFHHLAESAFESSIAHLMEKAIECKPSIVVVESKRQADAILKAYPDTAQPPPEADDDALVKDVVILAKYQGRSSNFGRRCSAMVNLPLASSVSLRKQIEGRLMRGEARNLHYWTIVPTNSVLDFLHQSQDASNKMQESLEHFVKLASELRSS